MSERKRLPGLSLLFCSRAEILAAPAEEREAYFRLVDAFLARPEECGFRRETVADLEADDVVDRSIHGMNQDWG